jgi:hypothetical protein
MTSIRRLTRRRLACDRVDATEIAPGLYRWTARHPAAVPDAEPGSPGDWPPDVGSVAYLADDALLVVDPLVPDDEAEFWTWLDDLASRRDWVAVVTTLQFHGRSQGQVARRYGASTSRAQDKLPVAVEPLPIRGAGETMFWIAEHGALVPGDRLLGDGDSGLRVCPGSWMQYLATPLSESELRHRLQFLLDLPIESILVSHGEPVLDDARPALARALET